MQRNTGTLMRRDGKNALAPLFRRPREVTLLGQSLGLVLLGGVPQGLPSGHKIANLEDEKCLAELFC